MGNKEKYNETAIRNNRKRRKYQSRVNTKLEKSDNKTPDSTNSLNKVKAAYNLSDIPNDKMLGHVHHHRDQILSHLKLSLGLMGKTGQVKNRYNVPGYGYNDQQLRRRLEMDLSHKLPSNNPKQLVQDAASRIKLRIFLRDDPFFNKQQLGSYLPEKPLDILTDARMESETKEYTKDRETRVQKEKHCHNYKYKNCGVVSSAGALLHSSLGSKIDSNDFVIRFNNAPTKGKFNCSNKVPDIGNTCV